MLRRRSSGRTFGRRSAGSACGRSGSGHVPGSRGAARPIEANPPPVAVSIGTAAACIIDISGLGKMPKTTTTRVPSTIGIAIDRSAAASRRSPAGSRRNIALSTRT